MATTQNDHGFPPHKLIGLFGGPLVAGAMIVVGGPTDLSLTGWSIASVAAWMSIWWMTEAIPLAATALLPLILFPLLGIKNTESTAASYAHPLIFLFLGGFLLARSMNVWGLDRRLAFVVLLLAGGSPRAIIGALMAVTAFLSMWVSNTATAMVMLPIGISIAATIRPSNSPSQYDPAPAVLLGIAYAATIGGMGTIIGTPPNALFAAFMLRNHGVEISFARWMLIGVPLVVILLPIAWFVLTRITYKLSSQKSATTPAVIRHKLTELGTISGAERRLAIILLLVAFGWLFRPVIHDAIPWLDISDTGIAMTGAMAAFLVPVDLLKGRFLLSWDDASKIRWDVLMLFGGGLALAAAAADSDLTRWLGSGISGLSGLPVVALLLLVGLLVVFVGELASNTAMAAVFIPVAGAAALASGQPAILYALPVALFATLGFMLPVATPPNAIVFGSGSINIRDMLRAGIILDAIGIIIVGLVVALIGELVFTSG